MQVSPHIRIRNPSDSQAMADGQFRFRSFFDLSTPFGDVLLDCNAMRHVARPLLRFKNSNEEAMWRKTFVKTQTLLRTNGNVLGNNISISNRMTYKPLSADAWNLLFPVYGSYSVSSCAILYSWPNWAKSTASRIVPSLLNLIRHLHEITIKIINLAFRIDAFCSNLRDYTIQP